MAAEAIGFDVGRPLMVVNCAQLIDKYVGESAKNIEKVFDEAKGQDAVLVFDECEGAREIAEINRRGPQSSHLTRAQVCSLSEHRRAAAPHAMTR